MSVLRAARWSACLRRRPTTHRQCSTARERAAKQGGVDQPDHSCYALGVTRWQVRATGRRAAVAVDRRPGRVPCTTVRSASIGRAVGSGAPRPGPRAVLDGASSLVAPWSRADSTGDRVRISVPRERARDGARVSTYTQTRRYRRTTWHRGVPPHASRRGRGARRRCGRSDKQAVLLLTMAVQQGLTTAERLGAPALRIKRDRRRLLIHAHDPRPARRGAFDQRASSRARVARAWAPGADAAGACGGRRTVRYFLDVYWDE